MDNKKLYRSKNDRIFLGVCGWLAKYFGIDPLIIRIAFIFAGVSLIAYLILAIVIPEEPEVSIITSEQKKKNTDEK